MQNNNKEKTAQKDPTEEEFRLTGGAGGVTPKWRQQQGATSTNAEERQNALRRREQQYYERQQQQQRDNKAASSLLLQQQQQLRPTHRPKASDLKPLTVVVPAFDLSLAEASLVFRTKVSDLQAVLEQMGEKAPVVQRTQRDDDGTATTISVPVDPEGWTLTPDTLEQLAILMDVPFRRAAPKNVLPNDEERLLQRRAAADPQETEADSDDATETAKAASARQSTMATTRPYEELPPRPPVVAVMGHGMC